MKHNRMLVVALIGLVFGFVSQVKAVFEFDLLNKTGNRVQVFIEDKENSVRVNGEAQNDKSFHHKVDAPSKYISIVLTIPGKSTKTYRINVQQRATCYVSYGEKNGKLTLYPQTGKLGGWLGKTESGHALDENANVRTVDISGN